MSASRTKIVELGCAGHLIVSNSCRWKRHTQVGKYRVSTIGDYYQPKIGVPGGERTERTTIGAGDKSFFETMVFKTSSKPAADNDGCGCRAVLDWGGIDGARYATAKEAQAGHERFIAKYRRKS